MLLLAACDPGTDTGDSVGAHIDLDGDSYSEREGDCDDGDAEVWPGATEYCNGKDDDCDGEVDDWAVDQKTVFQDDDGDGYGDDYSDGTYACPKAGRATNGDDCDDSDVNVNPSADEVCGNRTDDNCSYTSDSCLFEGDWTLGDTGSPARFGEPGDGAGTALAAFENTTDYDGLTANLAIAGREANGGAGMVWVAYSDFRYPDALDGNHEVGGGTDAVANLGSALTFADLTGDGAADLAIAGATPGASGRVGVYLIPGPIEASHVVPDEAGGVRYGDMELASPDMAFYAAPDADQDGRGDLLVGAPGAGQHAGAAWLLTGFGAVGEADLADAWATLGGADTGEEFGASMIVADLAGDGSARVLGGAPGAPDGGRVYVLELEGGPQAIQDAWIASGGAAGGRAGATLLAVGDPTGDGIDDLAVDAPRIGTVWLIDGALLPASSRLADAAATTITGTAVSTDGGRALLWCDADDDGTEDLFVGDPAASTVWALRGRLDAGSVDVREAGGSIAGDEEFGASLACGLAYGPDETTRQESNKRLTVGAPAAESGGGAIRDFKRIGQ